MAMVSRGYDGEVRVAPMPKLAASSLLVLALGLATLAILLGLAYLF